MTVFAASRYMLLVLASMLLTLRLLLFPDPVTPEVLRLFRAGVLDLITLHLASLQQSEALIARRQQG